MVNRPPWNNGKPPEPSTSPTLCLHWHVGCDTRCVLSPDRQTAIDRTRFRTKIVDLALRRTPTGTTRDSSVSAVTSLDTCHMRTRCPQLDASLPFRQVGWQLQSDNRQQRDGVNQQETIHRPRPYPHRSVFTSSRLHVIIMHQHTFIPLTAGYFIQSYSTTSEFMYRNIHVN